MNKILIIIIVTVIIVIIGGAGLFFNIKKEDKFIIEEPYWPGFTESANDYSLEDILSHNTEDDCWMVINDKVYDVTTYISMHPGGKAILNGCGKDATDLFENRPTNLKKPHPDNAREKLKNYYIGNINL